jgi:hypothetical protein
MNQRNNKLYAKQLWKYLNGGTFIPRAISCGLKTAAQAHFYPAGDGEAEGAGVVPGWRGFKIQSFCLFVFLNK